MTDTFTAKTQVETTAPLAKVWQALITPAMIKQYMFGTDAVSTWEEGAPIVWRGEWEGKPYEDKGQILQMQAPHRLQYTHFSPLAGQPDVPENYHTVTIEVSTQGAGTRITLTQDNNATADEQAQAEKNWGMMLDGLKKFLEK